MQGHSQTVPLLLRNMQTIHRLGTFFILVGLAAMVLFVGSAMSKDTNPRYLLLAIVALSVGFLVQRNKPTNDSGRFGAVRRANARRRQRREDSNNKPKK